MVAVSLLTLLILIFVYGFFLPSQVHVERSIEIEKPQSMVFDYLADFRNFPYWSPWHEIDPTTRYDFSNNVDSIPQKISWKSKNAQVGEGYQEIVNKEGSHLIKIELSYSGKNTGTVHYEIQPTGTGSRVIWQYDTDFGNNPFGRYIGLLIEDMIGPPYEQGLAKLKLNLEKR